MSVSPWSQPLQTLTEVVVEEEVQGLHALVQALLQSHLRGAARNEKRRELLEKQAGAPVFTCNYMWVIGSFFLKVYSLQ